VVAWTYKSRVLLEGDRMTLRKYVLGLPFKWTIPFSEIRRVQVRHEMLEGVKEKDRGWDIEVDVKAGDSVELGVSLRDRVEAERLVEEMRRTIRSGVKSLP
jgi:hypothetical protein